MSFETEETIPVGNGTPNEPVETPPAPAATPEQVPASAPATPAFDLSKLNESLRPLGNYEVRTEADVVKILQDKLSGMHKAHEERAQLEAELRRLKPLAEQSQRQTYMPPSAEMPVESDLAPVLGPVYQELAEARNWRQREEAEKADRAMRSTVERLAAEMPGFVTQDVKAELVTTCIATGDYDPEKHFYKQYGKAYGDYREKMALQKAVTTIRANNAATAGLGSPTAVAAGSVVDPMTLDEKQQEQWLIDQFHKYERDGAMAERAVKEYEEKAGIA